mmetsp:Transcript_106957/g.310542  ORF Transcript_106957/g.310542 Transcript_106957/m.310542 type:complete len:916 (-) Transcript_106957:9121-11868(-)
MAAGNNDAVKDEPYYKKMSNVLSFEASQNAHQKDRLPGEDLATYMERIVRKHVQAIVTRCKTTGEKFTDGDFGPSEEDATGALSLYGNPPKKPGAVGSTQYPEPDALRWDRPMYAADHSMQIMSADGQPTEAAEPEDDDGAEIDGADDEQRGLPWCRRGELFKASAPGGSGASAGDVVQGALGDCWFLGALSVLATNERQLTKVFWPESNPEQFRDQGMFVLRFFKDAMWHYVIIDDRIPVYDNDEGLPVFAKCHDKDELWVLFVEKAYAKLHGSYKSLIGGFVHNALADLTGYVPELLITKKGHQGYTSLIPKREGEGSKSHAGLDSSSSKGKHKHKHKKSSRRVAGSTEKALTEDVIAEMNLVWQKLGRRHHEYAALMGCSIQPAPGASKKEAEGPSGLRLMHAYGLLDIGEISRSDEREAELEKLYKENDVAYEKKEAGSTQRLVLLRNPWGYGEWKGLWSDCVDTYFERQVYNPEINAKFHMGGNADGAEVNSNDGSFYMPFEKWYDIFTHVFIAMDLGVFGEPKKPTLLKEAAHVGQEPQGYAEDDDEPIAPPEVPQPEWQGAIVEGRWDLDAGGNRQMQSWACNPKYELKWEADNNPDIPDFECYVSVSVPDARMTHGIDYWRTPLQQMPLSFDVVAADQLDVEWKKHCSRSIMYGSYDKELEQIEHPDAPHPDLETHARAKSQPPFNYGSVQYSLNLIDDACGVHEISQNSADAGEGDGKEDGDDATDVSDGGEGAKEGGEAAAAPPPAKQGSVAHCQRFIIPSLFNRKVMGTFFIRVHANREFKLTLVNDINNDDGELASVKKVLASNNRVEDVRERLLGEIDRLGTTVAKVSKVLTRMSPEPEVSKIDFKSQLVDLGMSLTDLPDSDFDLLDKDKSGLISVEEFSEFLQVTLNPKVKLNKASVTAN